MWFIRVIMTPTSITSSRILTLAQLRSHFGAPSAGVDNFFVTAFNGDGRNIPVHVEGVTQVNDEYLVVFDREFRAQMRFYVLVLYFPNGCEKIQY